MHNLPHLRAPVGRSPLAVAISVAVILLLVAGLFALSAPRGEVPPAPIALAGDPIPAAIETVPAAAASVDDPIDYSHEQPPTF